MKQIIPCPRCGYEIALYKNPLPTVDIILYTPAGQVLLIERKNPPHGWALPGGFVDYGESVEEAAVREVKEEVGVDIRLQGLLGVYSSPSRDPRHHTLTVVFTAPLHGIPDICAGDDALSARLFPLEDLPEMAFDHARILSDFTRWLAGETPPSPISNGASICTSNRVK